MGKARAPREPDQNLLYDGIPSIVVVLHFTSQRQSQQS